MAENREDERAVSGEDSLLDGGFTWLRETVPLKETPPAPRAAGAAPGSPAGEPAVSAEEEAALYLFGGPEEGDGNTGTPVKQKAAGSGGDPDAPATDAAEGPDVFAGVRDAEPAGAAASPDSDPAPDLALEGDPGEADQDIAEEENEGSAAVAALGRLLGSRQDVPYSEKENVHYYNNINKSGPEDGAFPEGAASVREEEAEPAPEEEEDDDGDAENQEEESRGRGSGRSAVRRRLCLTALALLVSGAAAWYASGSGSGDGGAGLPTTAAEAELVRRQAGALRALPQAEDGSGGPLSSSRAADRDEAAAQEALLSPASESGTAPSASAAGPAATVRPAVTDVPSAADGEPLMAEAGRPATAEDLRNGFAALREDLKKLGESFAARQAAGEEDIRALRRAARDLQAAAEKSARRADASFSGRSAPRKAEAGEPSSPPSGGLEGWSVLGLSATRAIVQDPGGKIWTVARGDRAGRLRIRDVDLATGNVSTDRGVIRYGE
ncbi:MAG: hypothetical protein PUK52_00365 [Desulfovibrio sp.]|nr:hypothetical protein [Desulfovibrio sp.]